MTRRFPLMLTVVALIAAAAAAAETAAEPLAARVAVFRRPLPYVNGVQLQPSIPTQQITAPAGGWGTTLEEIRSKIQGRKLGSGTAVAEILPVDAIGAEGRQVFAAMAGGAVEFHRVDNGIAVKLPQASKSITLPAATGTHVFTGKDEMVYLAITFVPATEIDRSVVVINNVRPPDVLQRVDAKMPAAAQEERVGGVVVLQARIEPDGHVSSAAVITAPRPDLGAAASEAVKQWKFSPTKKDGQPVVAYLSVTMNFTVQ